MIIAVDFDGTLVEHRFPDIGPEVSEAFEWCRRFIANGAELILWTVRSDGQLSGPVLSDAIMFCKNRGVRFIGHNMNPTQEPWSSSPKAYAELYIDDAAFGAPLVESKHAGWRPHVDWTVVGPEVMVTLKKGSVKNE